MCLFLSLFTPRAPLCYLELKHSSIVYQEKEKRVKLESPSIVILTSLPSPPAFSLSWHQGLFQWVSSLHQVAKVLEFFSFSISPSNEYSGLISFRMDWLDLLAVQGILKSLLQHHSSKASIHWCSAFFMVLLSHPYMTTGKTSSFYSHIWDVKLVFAYCLLYLDSWFIGGPHFVVVL